MEADLRRAAGWTPLTLRFALSGIVATATYFVTARILLRWTNLDPVIASALASGVSILVSYLGHHSFTFRRQGNHGFYFPRFAAATATLFGLSTAAMYMSTRILSADPVAVAFAIAVAYPVASYALNALWVFRTRRGAVSVRSALEDR